MIYPNLTFPKFPDRPWVAANFVQTIDGVVAVRNHPEYWPLGSRTDYQTLLELRAAAGALMHGRVTALAHPTVQSLESAEFAALRSDTFPYHYLVVSDHPTEALRKHIQPSSSNFRTRILTFNNGIASCLAQFKREGITTLLVEGGPHLFTSFLAEDLLDELFLTIAPTVIGHDEQALTLTTGRRFPADAVRRLQLVSTIQHDDELYLRYQRKRGMV